MGPAKTQWRTEFTSDVFRPYAGIYSWSRRTRKEEGFLCRPPHTHKYRISYLETFGSSLLKTMETGSGHSRTYDAVSVRRLMPWKQETWIYSQVIHTRTTVYSPPATTQAFLTHPAKPSDATKPRPVTCAFCKGPHFPTACTKVTDIDKRIDIVKRDYLCYYNCLGSHKLRSCKSAKRCRPAHDGQNSGLAQRLNMHRLCNAFFTNVGLT